MKLLIILNDLRNGGIERVLSILANYFANKNHEVHILAIASDEVAYAVDPKIHYRYMPAVKLYKRIGLFHEIRGMAKIFGAIREIKPDWLIGFDDSIIIRSVPAAWLLGKKILVSERIDPSIYGAAMRFVRQIAYDMADAVVFQTEDARRYFPKRTQKKSAVIPNPIKENLPRRNPDSHNHDIIMACRLRGQKNIPMAIDAFEMFYAKYSGYRLVVYGEGELKECLKASVKQKGLQGKVIFPGYSNDIYEKMRECAMYISSSDYEGLSNSMLEALAIGVPSVVTDCPVGGARMFVKNGENGVLVPTGDAAAMAEGMKKIAGDAAFACNLSQNAVKIRNTLDAETICAGWEKIIHA
jgi:glycosyltransferase involved in cell wall biosynthesis